MRPRSLCRFAASSPHPLQSERMPAGPFLHSGVSLAAHTVQNVICGADVRKFPSVTAIGYSAQA